MARAPYQVLVFPYRVQPENSLEYALFKRRDAGYWQAIAGGGEAAELPLDAARREAWEEAGIPLDRPYLALDSQAMLPVEGVTGFLWGEAVLVIPEHCFAVDVGDLPLVLSREHTELCWVDYAQACQLLKWDSNRTALWELQHRLQRRRSGRPSG